MQPLFSLSVRCQWAWVLLHILLLLFHFCINCRYDMILDHCLSVCQAFAQCPKAMKVHKTKRIALFERSNICVYTNRWKSYIWRETKWKIQRIDAEQSRNNIFSKNYYMRFSAVSVPWYFSAKRFCFAGFFFFLCMFHLPFRCIVNLLLQMYVRESVRFMRHPMHTRD